MVIEELVKTVLSELRSITKTENVVGEPVKLENVTVIPVSRISVGFGAGGGESEKEPGKGEAAGGGASIDPIAFIVVKKDKVEVVSLKDEKSTIGKVIDLVPELFDKVKDLNKKGKDES